MKDKESNGKERGDQMSKRMTIELSNEILRKMESLQKNEGYTSKADIIRNGITLLSYVTAELEKGRTLAVTEDGTKVVKEFVLAH